MGVNFGFGRRFGGGVLTNYREFSPTRSYFGNARLKVSNFEAQYLRLQLHSSTTGYRQHGSHVTAVIWRAGGFGRAKRKKTQRCARLRGDERVFTWSIFMAVVLESVGRLDFSK